ncbi:MAG: autotransporter domain-containing protein, partial [Pseudomonadota bacterium]
SEDSSLLGRFGARVGKGFGSGKTKGVAYLGAHYVSEFQGDDAVAFTSNGRAETFGARPFEDFVETRAGVTLGSETSPWNGGIEGHLLFGDDLDGYGVSANVRYRF